jgi:hypothetical protein
MQKAWRGTTLAGEEATRLVCVIVTSCHVSFVMAELLSSQVTRRIRSQIYRIHDSLHLCGCTYSVYLIRASSKSSAQQRHLRAP